MMNSHTCLRIPPPGGYIDLDTYIHRECCLSEIGYSTYCKNQEITFENVRRWLNSTCKVSGQTPLIITSPYSGEELNFTDLLACQKSNPTYVWNILEHYKQQQLSQLTRNNVNRWTINKFLIFMLKLLSYTDSDYVVDYLLDVYITGFDLLHTRFHTCCDMDQPPSNRSFSRKELSRVFKVRDRKWYPHY